MDTHFLWRGKLGKTLKWALRPPMIVHDGLHHRLAFSVLGLRFLWPAEIVQIVVIPLFDGGGRRGKMER